MFRIIGLSILLLFSYTGFSQHRVTMVVKTKATTEQSVYLAGNFNGWNPKDEKYQLRKTQEGVYEITINNISSEAISFKFTKGSWQTVETDSLGGAIANRNLQWQGDTIIHCTISSWNDKMNQQVKNRSTASKHVAVLDTAFYMPSLQRYRRIWIYLPPGYHTTNKKFPVLYMQDGQNLFDTQTSFGEEWGVDEYLDSIKANLIVVGIDNGQQYRMTEYNTFNHTQFGKGEGKAYLQFIVNSLKPFVDQHYRTLRSQKHTAIAGSSMGGLISFCAGMYYPKTFGIMGVFSPAFWVVPELKAEIENVYSKQQHAKQRYYFYGGDREGANMVPLMKDYAASLQTISGADIKISVDPDGKHNEAAWRKSFPEFYQFATKK